MPRPWCFARPSQPLWFGVKVRNVKKLQEMRDLLRCWFVLSRVRSGQERVRKLLI